MVENQFISIRVSETRRLTSNVVYMPVHSASGYEENIEVDGEAYTYFRGDLYIRGPVSGLNAEDIRAINDRWDSHGEPKANKRVKTIMGRALSAYFNDRSFHLTELGCGAHPILPYLDRNTGAGRVHYQAVECDERHVKRLQEKGIKAGNWEQFMRDGDAPQGMASVAVAVYALHFMANNKLPRRLEKAMNAQGFFLANLYLNDGNDNHAQLKTVFDRAGLDYLAVKDPANAHNEFWIASKPGHAENLQRLEDILTELLDAEAQGDFAPSRRGHCQPNTYRPALQAA